MRLPYERYLVEHPGQKKVLTKGFLNFQTIFFREKKKKRINNEKQERKE